MVDNEDSEETSTIVESASATHGCGIRYVAEPAVGLCNARNRGLREAKGDLIVFLDDDAIPDPGWVEALSTGAVKYPKAGVFGGPSSLECAIEQPDWLDQEASQWKRWLGYWQPSDTDLLLTIKPNEGYPGPHGLNMAFRREAVGDFVFDPSLGRQGKNLLSGDEAPFVRAISSTGWEVRYLIDAAVTHLVPADRLTQDWFLDRGVWEGITVCRALYGDHEAKVFEQFANEKLLQLNRALHGLNTTNQPTGSLPMGTRIALAYAIGVAIEGTRVMPSILSDAAVLQCLSEIVQLSPMVSEPHPQVWVEWLEQVGQLV